MFGAALVIFFSFIAVLTIPGETAGTFLDGARTIVVLQGMAFNAIGVIYGSVWAYRNRSTIREMFRDLING